MVVEVVVIVGWDLFCWEDEMTREDFLLKKGFECRKFWTLEGTKFWEVFIGDEGDIELIKEEEEKWIFGSWTLFSTIRVAWVQGRAEEEIGEGVYMFLGGGKESEGLWKLSWGMGAWTNAPLESGAITDSTNASPSNYSLSIEIILDLLLWIWLGWVLGSITRPTTWGIVAWNPEFLRQRRNIILLWSGGRKDDFFTFTLGWPNFLTLRNKGGRVWNNFLDPYLWRRSMQFRRGSWFSLL